MVAQARSDPVSDGDDDFSFYGSPWSDADWKNVLVEIVVVPTDIMVGQRQDLGPTVSNWQSPSATSFGDPIPHPRPDGDVSSSIGRRTRNIRGGYLQVALCDPQDGFPRVKTCF